MMNLLGTWGPVIGSVVGGLIVILGWSLIQRPLERRDKQQDRERDGLDGRVKVLEGDLKDVRDRRVDALEDQVEHGHESRGLIRRDLTDKISEVRQTFVHKKECKEFREEFVNKLSDFNSSVLKLERVSERTDQALKTSREVMEQVVSVKEDLARLAGRIEAANGKMS